MGGETCASSHTLLVFLYFNPDKVKAWRQSLVIPLKTPEPCLGAHLSVHLTYAGRELVPQLIRFSGLTCLSVNAGSMPSSMSSMELPLSSSFMGPSCWLRVSTLLVQSGRSLATTRPPSAARA